MANNFRELKVWNKAIELSKRAYAVSRSMPESERYGLAGQLQRASVSIACNIAEGAGRKSPKEFSKFLSVAMGSSYEVETLLVIGKEVMLISYDDFELLHSLNSEIQKMINKLTDVISVS